MGANPVAVDTSASACGLYSGRFSLALFINYTIDFAAMLTVERRVISGQGGKTKEGPYGRHDMLTSGR